MMTCELPASPQYSCHQHESPAPPPSHVVQTRFPLPSPNLVSRAAALNINQGKIKHMSPYMDSYESMFPYESICLHLSPFESMLPYQSIRVHIISQWVHMSQCESIWVHVSLWIHMSPCFLMSPYVYIWVHVSINFDHFEPPAGMHDWTG